MTDCCCSSSGSYPAHETMIMSVRGVARASALVSMLMMMAVGAESAGAARKPRGDLLNALVRTEAARTSVDMCTVAVDHLSLRCISFL